MGMIRDDDNPTVDWEVYDQMFSFTERNLRSIPSASTICRMITEGANSHERYSRLLDALGEDEWPTED